MSEASGGEARGRCGSWFLAGLFVVALAVFVTAVVVRRPTAAEAEGDRHAPARTVEAVLRAAADYMQAGERAKAEAVLSAAVREHPANPDLRLAFGEVLVALGRPGEAYREYEAALACGADGAAVHFAAGTVASMAGLPDRAVEHFAAAQAADPTKADYPLYLAQVQLRQGDVQRAKVNLLLAARLDEGRAVVWGTLAEVALRENKADLALQHVARAREIEPRVTAWRVVEARALNRLGEPERALLALRGVEGADARSLPVLRLMGECYGLLGRPGDAAREIAQASDASPGDAELAFEAATWMERAGSPDEALRLARRAMEAGHAGAAEIAARLGGG
ncbi:MAG: tetratricopeptide repeat protein [Phycisphaeraceae bacterium]|nr:tetratricopeptide repeat protein [Phycisphaeraceae bacterium]